MKSLQKKPSKALLLATVSALSLMLNAPAKAQDPSWWASVEGATTLAEGTSYFGFIFATPETTGASYSLEIGKNLGNSGWSVSGGIRHSFSDSSYYNSYSPYYGGPVAWIDHFTKETITTIDLEIGRDVGIGGLEGRATVGIRRLQHDYTFSYYYYGSPSSYYGLEGNTSFTGTGPRLALETNGQISDKISFDTEVGVALLFGQRNSSGSVSYYGGGFYGSATENQDIVNIDVSASLSYSLNRSSKVSFGMRIDSFSTPSGYFFGDPSDTSAFIKLSTEF